MLPGVVASELKDTVAAFLRQAFPFANPYFQQREEGEDSPMALIDGLIDNPGRLFKGPYLDIKLPFRKASAASLPFRHLQLPFIPYQHQLRAFERLTGDHPKSTIIATGTGSGKTECFMLPVLDDALGRRRQGIKTIVVYPMNALAADQARRFAQEVAKLDTRITVGLYVGGEPDNAPAAMGPEQVITNQQALRKNPPDILLTNYKMLDFLLIRPKDQQLWRFNQPGVLRYLVVDELHTFDGAQGTDLACLIRRLRDRLGAGDELACVGTSATMGADGEDAVRQLLRYAADVFAADFKAGAIIEEDRLSAEEYLGAAEYEYFNWPEKQEQRLDPARYEQVGEYLFHQARLWFADKPASELPQLNASDPHRRAEAAVALGELLPQHEVFKTLIKAGQRLRSLPELAEEWQSKQNLPSRRQAELLLTSLLSLVSTARLANDLKSTDPKEWTIPLLYVRQQLWLRELRRMVCLVPEDDRPARLAFADDLKNAKQPLHLPLLHCRECHLGAWGAITDQNSHTLSADNQSFYEAWFGYSPKVCLLVPLAADEETENPEQFFCPRCKRLQAKAGEGCLECGHNPLRRVRVPDMIKQVTRGGEQLTQAHHDCPDCGARDALAIVGYRAATLTSVMTGRLFNTPYNDDYKLIAFSDSVQDAAHRAGFLEANTWREVLRQAMARWLRQQPPGINLLEMTELLPGYWSDRAGNEAGFVALFMPSNLAWHPHYQALVESKPGAEVPQLPPDSPLPVWIRKRLSWECLAEFGRRSRIGRSLERTGVATVGPDHEALFRDLDDLARRLREELGSLRQAGDEVFRRFVLGWFHYLRTIGAIDHEALRGYLTHGGKEYLINQRMTWMPNYGRSRRPPAAISLQHLSNNFEALFTSRQDSWSVRWLKKTLGAENLFAPAEARQIFTITLDHLVRRGWLVEHSFRDQPLWLLDPRRLLVEREVETLRCDLCRHPVPVGRSVVADYRGMPCLRVSCRGHLSSPSVERVAVPYGTAEPRRLVPHEHTGLLTPEVRKLVEHSFMEGTEPWHINLLSATPTLEMGIDIGALSTVLLCSVPPAQASYLQRIGRAGRRDGNALAVTIANGRNHDLYFYDEPLEMIAGRVQTPGVFLQAIAVLERQLIAYCFDRWAATGIDESAIPGQLRQALDAVEHGRQQRFPYNLLAFVAANRDQLLPGFLALFPGLEENGQARDYLHSFIHETGERSLSRRLVNRLQELVNERASLLKKTRELKKQHRLLAAKPADDVIREEMEQVSRERNALLALINGRNNQATLNFFTDEGLLPNYAFPEEGVTLQSVILRRLGTEAQGQEGKKYEKTSYTFQRPATAALSELAPESRFYAVSHEMEIDQVDLNLSRVEQWRFCDRCQYSEQVDMTDRHSACPRCGSPQWADSGQKQQVLRLRQVYATVDSRAHRIGDDSDQRQPSFYNRQMLVDVARRGQGPGFRLRSDVLPFGFEFVEKVNLREVNFGPSGEGTTTFAVAGKVLGRQGFRICKVCGKVQKRRPSRRDQPHAYACPLRTEPERATDDDFYQSLYLYRELESEAIRILLPLSEVAYSDEKLHSFIAALNLGLKAYFRGDVDHLQVTEMREPATGQGQAERVYLVIYDRIPGGTGYLKELMSAPEKLFKVLELARERLATCACIDDGEKDGCYRCILAYRDSRNMPTISRHGAEKLLREILELADQLEVIENLSEVSTNTLIESKLEQRFVDALAALPGAELGPKLINGKNGWLLTLPGAAGRSVAWQVEHQVRVGPAEGVALQTEIDVLLTPARAEDAARYRPIAVYLDGLQYHHDRVDDDVCKRAALLLSGRYWVYSLTWDDVPNRGFLAKALEYDIMRQTNGSHRQMTEMFNQMADRDGWEPAAEHNARHSRNAFEWLTDLLREPEMAPEMAAEMGTDLFFAAKNKSVPISVPISVSVQRAVYRGWTALVPQWAREQAAREKLGRMAEELMPAPAAQALALTEADCVPGSLSLRVNQADVVLLASLPLAAIKGGSLAAIPEQLGLHLCFDDRENVPTEVFKNGWRAFWHAANQLQFAPGFSLASRRAVASGQLEQVWEQAESIRRRAEEVASALAADSASWPEVEKYSVLTSERLAAIKALGLPAPEVGVDLLGGDQAVVLGGEQVELAWPERKVAVVLVATEQEPPGWQLLLDDDRLLEKLNQVFAQGGADGTP